MARDWIGQKITFAAEADPDANYNGGSWVKAKQGETIRAIAARRGHPEWAEDVLRLNRNRDVLPHPKRRPGHGAPPIPRLHTAAQRLRAGAQIRLPGVMGHGNVVTIHAGDNPPVIKTGYAKYDVVDVPGRVGLNRFLGYDPLSIDIPVQFEEYVYQSGLAIEHDISLLEKMAGRGAYPGAAVGPPAVIRVTVTDNRGHVVPLIPADFQWSRQHQNAPLFRISAIAWDAGALRTPDGYRTRQTGTVTVTQYTPIHYVIRSVSQRTATIPSRTGK